MSTRHSSALGGAAWVLASLIATACLPSRIAQGELDEMAATGVVDPVDASGADTTQADGNPADTSGATGCGNGKVEGKEECDFSGANWCNGCDKCQRRTTWKIDGNDAMVTAVVPADMAAALGEATTGFSLEFWFKASQLPSATDSAGIAAVAGKSLAGPAFAVALVRDQSKNAAYVTCAYVPKQNDTSTGLYLQGNNAIKVGEWHHVRCGWSAADQMMMLSQDGADEPATLKAVSKPTQLFESDSTFIVGSLSLGIGKAGFKGELDELRMVTGANASNFKFFQARYSGEGQGVALLLHMDEAEKSTLLMDSSTKNLHMRQTSKQPLGFDFEKVPLVFQPESCYGYSQPQINCAPAAQPKAPFCKAL